MQRSALIRIIVGVRGGRSWRRAATANRASAYRCTRVAPHWDGRHSVTYNRQSAGLGRQRPWRKSVRPNPVLVSADLADRSSFLEFGLPPAGFLSALVYLTASFGVRGELDGYGSCATSRERRLKSVGLAGGRWGTRSGSAARGKTGPKRQLGNRIQLSGVNKHTEQQV